MIAGSFFKALHLIHDWREETADLGWREGLRLGWTHVRECRTCHKVEKTGYGGDWYSVSGLDLVDLRRALKHFRKRWVMVGDRRVRKGATELRARAAIREAERLGLR